MLFPNVVDDFGVESNLGNAGEYDRMYERKRVAHLFAASCCFE